MKQYLTYLLFLLSASAIGQTDNKPVKISHAEPLYIDLIRDLGARKGEKEINVGWIMEDRSTFITQSGFAEFEFSPLNRLGLEVEVPFRFSHTIRPGHIDEAIPKDKVEGVKMAAQYTFLVSPENQLSAALGSIYEINLHSLSTFQKTRTLIKGNTFNPFLIVAKKWGAVNTLLYTGPSYYKQFDSEIREFNYQVNMSLHYVLPSSNFIGVEVNHETSGKQKITVIHPQIKVKIAQGLAIGFAPGIPVNVKNQSLSFLTRLIYEPGRKK
jgi:hypothetical protein